jgi:hypothetical protein
MSDVTSAPPPTVETHDPIPEANWFWRRLFTFIFVTIMIAGLWAIGWQMHELAAANAQTVVDKLYGMFRYLVLLTFVSVTYYMVAPSAEQVTRMWQTAGLFKQGLTQTVTQVATAADGSKASATTTTGPATDTPLPPPGAVPPPPPAPPPEEPPWPTR